MTTPAVLFCPGCGAQHVDKGKWAKFDHKRHLCYGCGAFFEAVEPNVGVATIEPREAERRPETARGGPPQSVR